MKINELVTAAKAASPKALKGLEDKRVARVVAAVLAEVGRQIEAAKEGKIDLKGFGRFVVAQKEVEKDGKKVTKKRITFRPSKKKGKGGGKGGQKKGGKGRQGRAGKTAAAEGGTAGA
ncbi:MAG TPA: hypothetical protein VJM11_08340 [Nevskiaceae bacterium]|nr:hypothetical protein [Nevskiaceae bacterium]